MAPIAPVFYFDFASPNAYLAHRTIPAIEARTGIQFRYMPVLLGGLFKLSGNQAPMTAFAGVPLKLAYQRIEMQRFITTHGLTKFRMNPHFPINTLALMRGAIAADAEGCFERYVESMFRFMWEDQRKLDDTAVLVQSLTDAGLPAERLLQRAQDASIKDQLAANTQAAHAAGVFGIPSFVVGTELYFGKDTLPDVEATLVTQAAKAKS